MLGVEGYGSDSDNGSDNEVTTSQPPTRHTASLAAQLSQPAKKSTFSLPPPSTAGPSLSSGLALPAPKKKAPKKITIGLPDLPKDEDADDDEDFIGRPPAKKPRLETGAGRSGLLSMLPAPKNKALIPPPVERVLGGGKGPGLVFRTTPTLPPRKATVEDVEDAEDDEESTGSNVAPEGNSIVEKVTEELISSISFAPTSLRKGRANISTEERHAPPPRAIPLQASAAPAIDFFGLAPASTPSSRIKPSTPIPSSAPTSSITPPPIPGLPTILSAPNVVDFTPPEPTLQDSYPGYYQLPSGAWAAHDPAYYKKFHDKWTKDYSDHVRALEKGIERGFEGVEKEGAQEVNALEEMEKAKVEIHDREEKKALTAGAGAQNAAPKMNIKGAALSGRARSRHQLATLLSEAYSNREELEEKIAQGRKNRKEAGNKYGF